MAGRAGRFTHLIHHPHKADGAFIARAEPELALHLIHHPGKRDGVFGSELASVTRIC